MEFKMTLNSILYMENYYNFRNFPWIKTNYSGVVLKLELSWIWVVKPLNNSPHCSLPTLLNMLSEASGEVMILFKDNTFVHE